ncbi:SDR family NAD(P)-dependent oxidoreductase [Pseudoroseomonas wenyumeiae]|uniref:SDR family NAD(P)-dependent oxidoreductase n=1 Tax=Teichococcus wenyumeiae TaxID=2478470 RepID=A0A3A9JA78_9PROT|nr:oxidoreductase [Pseudoroseomonas wenyumeiae]RKK02960.1 SDR family NAD(P)-dependent oxidoreductase [Pseudoroseomonas wenyumeiae]RMI17436.1 SDR family NAD(P)-dependent oxidoreductase [Pseudoroseomonas wenyumeiae]
MTKTWLITGCSSGFGRILAEAVLARGDQAIITARDPESLRDLVARYPDAAHAMTLDVTKAGDAAAAAAEVEARFGGLDILVNNAGFGFVGAVEESEPAEYRPMFETNVFGLIETTRAVLPALRRSGGGRIVNFSSVGGITGRMGFGLYNATKFAVEGLSEALAEEVEPFGIKVVIVEPGAFRTDFLGRSIASAANVLPAYAETAGWTRQYREDDDGSQAGDPQKAIAVLLKAVDEASPPLHLPLGKDAYARARAKFAAFQADMAAWEAQATDTGFEA